MLSIFLCFSLLIIICAEVFTQGLQSSTIRDTLINGSYYKTEGKLLNGLEEGHYHFWYLNGSLYQMGSFSKGSRVGLWYFFDYEGKLSEKGSYFVNDSLIQENIAIRSEVVDTLGPDSIIPDPIALEKDTTWDDFGVFDDAAVVDWAFVDDEQKESRPVRKLFQNLEHGKWTYYDGEGDAIYYEIYDKGKRMKYVKLKEYYNDFDGVESEWGQKLPEEDKKKKGQEKKNK
ncbi:MAG: hypothetical protein AAF696_07085 [Bacteroidota bacterium]